MSDKTNIPQDLVIKAENIPSLNVLVSAIHVAQNKGAYSLGDAAQIHKALTDLFGHLPQPSVEDKEDQ